MVTTRHWGATVVSGQMPGRLLNILQGTGRPPEQRRIPLPTSTVLRLRNPLQIKGSPTWLHSRIFKKTNCQSPRKHSKQPSRMTHGSVSGPGIWEPGRELRVEEEGPVGTPMRWAGKRCRGMHGKPREERVSGSGGG